MSRHTGLGAAATLLVLAAACADVGTGNTTTNALLLNAAFQSVPAGFSATSNSFDGSGDHGLPFFPDSMVGDDSLGHQHGEPGDSMGMGGHHGDHSGDGDFGGHHDGFGHGGLLGLLMGGGLGPDFIGAFRSAAASTVRLARCGFRRTAPSTRPAAGSRVQTATMTASRSRSRSP